MLAAVIRTETKQFNVRYSVTYKKMLTQILKKKGMSQTTYLLSQIEKDYKEMFGDYSLEYQGLVAYFLEKKDIQEVENLIHHYQENGLDIDETFFSHIVRRKGGIVLSDRDTDKSS